MCLQYLCMQSGGGYNKKRNTHNSLQVLLNVSGICQALSRSAKYGANHVTYCELLWHNVASCELIWNLAKSCGTIRKIAKPCELLRSDMSVAKYCEQLDLMWILVIPSTNITKSLKLLVILRNSINITCFQILIHLSLTFAHTYHMCPCPINEHPPLINGGRW